MRRVPIDFLQEGMVVGRSIVNTEGKILLTQDTILTSKYIERLSQLGFASVYIKDDLSNIDIPDIVSQKTRVYVTQTLKETSEFLKKRGKLNIKSVQKSVALLVDELLANRNVLFNLEDIRTYDGYLLGHSINVGILSIIIAISMGYDQLKLQEIGIGAVLHDIGKTLISTDILNKPGPLTPIEFNSVRKHSEFGFEILRTNQEISLLSAHVAFQHHERWDGTGYPRGLATDQITQHARIVAVADVFDALIADRQYRPGYPTNLALAIIKDGIGKHFEPLVVNHLIANVAAFPVGSIVLLNTGEIAVVTETRKDHPQKPVIKIIFDANHRRLKQSRTIDLSTLSRFWIKETLTEPEINKLITNSAADSVG
jgi:HD-GYP domain-containing protein (c-di-GMP phosphodiesterase class II)